MRIAVLSDSHLGHGSGELERDALDNFREALEKALDYDLIILPGDVFDSKVPTPEILSEAMEMLLKTKAESGRASFSEGIGKDMGPVSRMAKSGVPIVAIHGTHERRTRGLVNPLQTLEKAGFLVYLHCNGVVLEKDGERVCIQGMSGVPENYAESVLKEWGPSPKEGCFNIFMLHQSVLGYVNSPEVLDPKKLPKGFGLYICGHMHEDKVSQVHGSPFLIPGSLIQTQLTKESPSRRGFYSLDIQGGKLSKLEKVELEGQRPVHYIEVGPERKLIEEGVKTLIPGVHKKKPLIRVRVKGDMDSAILKEIEAAFSDKAIISFRKDQSEEAAPAARGLEEQRLSVQELGMKLLKENLEKAGLDPKMYCPVF